MTFDTTARAERDEAIADASVNDTAVACADDPQGM